MTKKEIVERNEILRVTVGSQLTGTNLPGTSDNDETSIFVEDKSSVYGMGQSLDHLSVRTQPEGVRSGPEDTDRMSFSLRKFEYLATKGNPSILLPLFAPDDMVIVDSFIGKELRKNADMFLSQESVFRFLGYMKAQHERMLGKGRQSDVPKRPELEAQYGFDTKYASHALRLAIQGYQIATEGTIHLPMKPEDRVLILSSRVGDFTKEQISQMLDDTEESIRKLLRDNKTVLPPKPDFDAINQFSIWAHERFWYDQLQEAK